VECRAGCGACCIAPSINSPMPGMPQGKPAGTPCSNLSDDFRCSLFGHAERPGFCGGLQPSPEMCGAHRDDALRWLADLEYQTDPGAPV
jgi:hypothetical protein